MAALAVCGRKAKVTFKRSGVTLEASPGDETHGNGTALAVTGN